MIPRSIGTGYLTATCGGGAEAVLARELEAMGMHEVRTDVGAVHFRGQLREMVRANLETRIASRILLPLASAKTRSYDELYRLCFSLPWHTIIPPRLSFRVWAVSRSRQLSDNRYAGLKTKDAIVDAQRRAGGDRSRIDRENAGVVVSVFVGSEETTIALDSSDRPLHLRGYRTETGEAPVRETVAATLLAVAGWDGTRPLLDPFCGSGTIAIEAALLSSRIAPGLLGTDFGFLRWPDFDRGYYTTLRTELEDRRLPASQATAPIIASDIDPEAVAMARRNSDRAGVSQRVTFLVRDVSESESPGAEGVVVTNPPYGERLKLDDSGAFYQSLGDTLKQRLSGTDVWLFSANREAMKRLGLRIASRHMLFNGGLESRLYHIPIY